MSEVIVTGAAGFIGSTLSEELVRRGHTVVGIDSFHPYYDPAIKRQNAAEVAETAEDAEGSFRLVEGSLLDDGDLEELPTEPEFVFHEAAIAGVRYSIDHPAEYSKINVLGTANLLEHIEETEKVVAASSSSVYGNVPETELPVSEMRDLQPIAPYPLSKVQMEDLLVLFEDLYGLDFAALRYFTVYGPRQRPDEAFTKFIRMALDGEELTIYGDGEQSRDFTHVSDVVEGTLLAAEHGDGIYNIGSGRRITVNEMVETLQEMMDVDVESTHVDQPEGDARHTHADISKATRELGYEPQMAFAEGAASCVDWVRRMRETELL